MPVIHLTTYIKAPIERVFDLSRSIDLHKHSMHHTNEQAVDGRKSGLIEEGEWVTWKAKHVGKQRYLTVAITCMQPYTLFVDEMQKGNFKMMKHEHHFSPSADGTIMKDIFHFESPYGWFGTMVNALFHTNYMKGLLLRRNRIIKEFAESDRWKSVLPALSNI